MHRHLKSFSVFVFHFAIFLVHSTLSAEEKTQPAIELGAPFRDNAVFQQKIPLPIWGTAQPKVKITITFGTQTKSTITASDGNWKVTLDPISADKLSSINKAPKGRNLTIAGELDEKKTSKTIENILIGEVWLEAACSNC